ncbi:hypothetical protein [Methylobacterium oxalidis]|nr:hypothetical protein [Methylobacterium oxalidis]
MALIAIGAARFLTAAGFEHPGRDCFLAAAAATALTMSIVRSVSGFDRG